MVESQKKNIIITIDGPTASGKSSVARRVAQELDICHLNTGLLYRAVGYTLVTDYGYTKDRLENPSENDIKAITDSGNLIYRYASANGIHVLLNGADITPYLKDKSVDVYASMVAKNKAVRRALLRYQRCLAEKCSLVAEGRDMGSVVFPSAQYKFFLSASLAVRAARWLKLQQKRGNNVSIQEAERIVHERDMRDQNRQLSPLTIPKNAHIIDTADKTVDDIAEIIVDTVHKKNQS